MGVKAGKGAKRDARLTRMNFSKDVFKTEAAVQTFLDDNNITGCEIEDEGDIFAAKSTTNGDVKLEKAVSTKTKHAGVTMFVAEVSKADAEGDAEGEDDDTTATGTDGGEPAPVEANKTAAKPGVKGATKAKTVEGEATETIKTDEDGDDDESDSDTELRFPSNKYDFWGAYMSNEGSLLGVLRDGMDYDNLPPGMDEIMSAVYTSAGNVLGSSDDNASKETKLKQIGEDFATLTMGMFEMFMQATEDATKSANTERRAKAQAFVDSFSASVTNASKGGAIAHKSDANVNTGKNAVTIDTQEAEGVTDEENLAAIIGKAVAEAIAPIQSELSTVKSDLRKAHKELSRSPTRRADTSIIDNLTADDDDEDEVTETAKSEAVQRFAEMFGVKAPKQNA